jgi:radical SAM protein with 4Fe4S-binding SPASM domain
VTSSASIPAECSEPHYGGMARFAGRALGRNIPLQAQIEVTGRCHLDCMHCYLDIKRPPKNELTLVEIERVLDELAAAGSMFLTITGGEIFLRRDILDIIAAAKQRHFAVRDRAMVAKVAALRPMAVEISVYGVHAHVHDRVTRRPGSLRKSLRAAVLLRQAGVPVAIKSPMIEGTGDAHFDLIGAAERIGASWRIDPSLMSRRDGGTEPLSSRPSIDSMARLYADERVGALATELPEPSPAEQAPCAIGRRVVHIAPNGDVHACTAFPIPAGNIRDASFYEIWNHSPVLNEIRSINLGQLEGACNGCGRQGYCGRCSAQALLEHGNFAGPSVEACDRAEAREMAAGIDPPPNAHRVEHSQPLGRRPLGNFVPLSSLATKR